MKLLFSVPSGYHLRELVLPLRRHLEAHAGVTEVHIVTPAAPIARNVFQEFGAKFFYHANPQEDAPAASGAPPAGGGGHKELFALIKPDVVITNTVGHDELDEPILRIAKEMGIATVTFIASWDNVWKIERLMQSNIPICIADRIIVWNSIMKRHLMQIFPDIAEERIAIIGAPRLDYFSQKDNIASKEEVYKQLGLTDTSRTFIHIATTELYPMEYIVQAIREAIDAKIIPNNPYIYASVHPGGSMEKYKSFEKYGVTVRFSSGRREDVSLPSFRYAPTEADVYFLLGVFTHASVLVNHSSTVALESLIAGVPVINVKFGKAFDWWRWHRSMVFRDFEQHYDDLVSDGATYIVTSKKELVEAVVNASKNPHAKDALSAITVKKMITTTNGTASKQVLDFILSI